MSSSLGVGDSDGSGTAGAAGPHGSYQLSLTDSHQSSASINPTLIIKIATPFFPNATVQRHQFFMPLPVTEAQITAKLATFGITALPWPDFNPRTETLVTKGLKVSLQVEAGVSVYFSYYGSGDGAGDAFSNGTTTRYSKDLIMVTDQVTISSTIHDNVSVLGDGTSASQPISGRAYMQITGTVGNTADTGTISLSATASVSPAIVPATDGATSIPTGNAYYILSKDPKLFGYGFIFYDVLLWNPSIP